MIRYVLMVVADQQAGFVVGMTKQKGPSHLIGKLTFPGGKMEEGETAEQAGSREMLEETGIEVSPADWVCFDVQRYEHYELHCLAANSDQVLRAHQCEQEPVWHLAIKRHQVYAQEQPQAYVDDFLPLLNQAQEALRNKSQVAAAV